jgi:hypothetical protein
MDPQTLDLREIRSRVSECNAMAVRIIWRERRFVGTPCVGYRSSKGSCGRIGMSIDIRK